MFDKIFGKPKIAFKVDGRPPRKFRGGSVWSSDSEAPLVKKLRENALHARNQSQMNQCFTCPVRLDLTIYAKNTFNSKDAHNYVGDIDGFVAGVCEALQPANEQAPPHVIFDNKDIDPKIPILFFDDSQVVEVYAKKIKSNEQSYVVIVQNIKKFN
jgi:hypothetical protein